MKRDTFFHRYYRVQKAMAEMAELELAAVREEEALVAQRLEAIRTARQTAGDDMQWTAESPRGAWWRQWADYLARLDAEARAAEERLRAVSALAAEKQAAAIAAYQRAKVWETWVQRLRASARWQQSRDEQRQADELAMLRHATGGRRS
ncbi:hypothetical protein GCM10010885_00350 [Alicyclobacillus cellulosilyticus]|uniref:Flagellar FliJ protein n=1 Tax=Alicyclobacillus cellulosilyticus TaxID=1003997 RepID=A0A917K1G0_9BACL|nr:flagellar FliJ family protein [Alicyclobacillus cellulosilyticus]GGI94755.1 hypothetical protein GCM10010885_00350 [Alicyclobacillus cellulosilyticus]